MSVGWSFDLHLAVTPALASTVEFTDAAAGYSWPPGLVEVLLKSRHLPQASEARIMTLHLYGGHRMGVES
jgi:hypothetical protein